MKIKRILVEQLNQHLSGEINFNERINVFTGPNGSGKTTLLKACWYLYSGNLANAFSEVDFRKIEVETEYFTVTLTCSDPTSNDPRYSIRLASMATPKFSPEGLRDALDETLEGTWSEIKDALWKPSILLGLNDDSLFFPTFRRVEGGYSHGDRLNPTSRRKSGSSIALDAPPEDELTKALRATSSALSSFDNKFVCSMSVADVEKLVSETRSAMDSRQKKRYELLAQKISTDIRKWQEGGGSESESASYLREILDEVTNAETERDLIAQPMKSLDEQISRYFPERAIKIKNQRLGSGSREVEATALSAGEKQLLSFLCYAALNRDCVFMVDEPELSLHLDWQRQLISSLSTMGTTHQYFFVTHSPAIYTKFSDFEIPIDQLLHTSA